VIAVELCPQQPLGGWRDKGDIEGILIPLLFSGDGQLVKKVR
jgi:hypothetical protein